MNIAIIGAGQLGGRHLQALAKIKKNANYYLVDPSNEALERSINLYKEITTNIDQITCLSKIEDLPREFELVVIATNSKQRLSVLENILDHASVKYLILEKFLFPTFSDYQTANLIIEKSETKVFVNCARRMWDSYQQLKLILDVTKPIYIKHEGYQWNMASNSVHFIDLIEFLTNKKTSSIDVRNLNQALLFNKREGYIEISGKIIIKTQNNNILELISNLEGDTKSKITIQTASQLIEIHELEGIMFINDEKYPFNMEFQSNLTNKVFEQLQDTDECYLVNYQDSARYHLLFLEEFNKFLNGREGAIT